MRTPPRKKAAQLPPTPPTPLYAAKDDREEKRVLDCKRPRFEQQAADEDDDGVLEVRHALPTPVKTPVRHLRNRELSQGKLRTSRRLFAEEDIYIDTSAREAAEDWSESNPFLMRRGEEVVGKNLPKRDARDGMEFIFRGKKIIRKAPPNQEAPLEPKLLFPGRRSVPVQAKADENPFLVKACHRRGRSEDITKKRAYLRE